MDTLDKNMMDGLQEETFVVKAGDTIATITQPAKVVAVDPPPSPKREGFLESLFWGACDCFSFCAKHSSNGPVC